MGSKFHIQSITYILTFFAWIWFYFDTLYILIKKNNNTIFTHDSDAVLWLSKKLSIMLYNKKNWHTVVFYEKLPVLGPVRSELDAEGQKQLVQTSEGMLLPVAHTLYTEVQPTMTH